MKNLDYDLFRIFNYSYKEIEENKNILIKNKIKVYDTQLFWIIGLKQIDDVSYCMLKYNCRLIDKLDNRIFLKTLRVIK